LFPVSDARLAHEAVVACGPERAVEVFLASPAAPGRGVAFLLRLRGLQSETTVQAFFKGLGFDAVVDTPTEVVLAAAGKPWTRRGGIVPLASARAGDVRVAFGVRAEPALEGSLLVSETRVSAVDDDARRKFRRYWRVVGPFAALIRRRWLRAAVAAAQTSDATLSRQ